MDTDHCILFYCNISNHWFQINAVSSSDQMPPTLHAQMFPNIQEATIQAIFQSLHYRLTVVQFILSNLESLEFGVPNLELDFGKITWWLFGDNLCIGFCWHDDRNLIAKRRILNIMHFEYCIEFSVGSAKMRASITTAEMLTKRKLYMNK